MHRRTNRSMLFEPGGDGADEVVIVIVIVIVAAVPVVGLRFAAGGSGGAGAVGGFLEDDFGHGGWLVGWLVVVWDGGWKRRK